VGNCRYQINQFIYFWVGRRNLHEIAGWWIGYDGVRILCRFYEQFTMYSHEPLARFFINQQFVFKNNALSKVKMFLPWNSFVYSFEEVTYKLPFPI
jgi:hypothetical protein